MPRFNDFEQATTGTGITWYDNARTLQQVCMNVCTLKLSDGTPISDRGDRIHMEARNRLWVSQDALGVYGSFGNIPGAAISSGPSKAAACYIGPDGSLIYKKSYQSEGPWFNTATGKDIPGDGDSWQNCGGGKWIARRGQVYDGGHMDIVDQDDRVLGRGVWPFWEDGHLLYQASTGELVYDGRTVFPPLSNYYRPCHRRRADGSVRFAWSPDESEQIVIEQVLTAEEMAACPLYQAVTIPTFHFTHPLLVAPFKDPEGQSDAPAEVIVNQGTQSVARPYIVAEDSLGGPFLGERLGVYTERTNLTALFAKFPYTRLVVGHDDISDWVLPALRPFDIPMQELYFPRTRGIETVAQSAARWQRQSVSLLQQWSGDCALDPQFYLMGGAPPNELYTEGEVLEGLSYLSDIANQSERFKLIVPFAFLRANGITAHQTLRTAFDALLRAAGTAGRPVLVPVPKPPEPKPDPPPDPKPPSLYQHHKERSMAADTVVVARGPGGKLGRPDSVGTGPWKAQGWRGLVFDGTDKTDARYHFVRRGAVPDSLVSKQTGGIVGCDATVHSGGLDKQFYVKPDGEVGKGWGETFQFYDGNKNGAIEAQVEYGPGFGGDEGAFFSYPLAIEVVS